MDFMKQGWECPKCGAVMSPTTSVCVNCRGNIVTNVVTAESAISALQREAEKCKCKGAYPDAFLDLAISETMHL